MLEPILETADLAIGAGGDQGRKITILGALPDLSIKPLELHARLLGIRQIAVAHDDDDLLTAKAGDVRLVA